MTVHRKSTSRVTQENADLERWGKNPNTGSGRSSLGGGVDFPLIELVCREKSKLFSR